jgi:membrane associated rhomboid family serine protease
MLEDRSYMKQWQPESPWDTAAVRIMVVNCVVFLVTAVAESRSPRAALFVDNYLALSLGGLGHGYVWQLVTFQFLHANLFHILGNMLAVFFFGRDLERVMGQKSFLTLYFGSGIVGGLFWCLIETLTGMGRASGGVVGASAGAFGLIAAYAMINPERSITLLLFFILPVTFRAKVLLWICLAIAVLGTVSPSDNVAHAAHLGGLLFGVFFVRSLWRSDIDWSRFNPLKRITKSRPSRAPIVSFKTAAKPVPKEKLSEADFMAQEIDPILDKISAHGIQSLTERERKILDAARSRMAKR